jgi:2-polyprenyl-3-methyl-5-hydroxy-6-metoxy-1,4-benzoquinol methylase
LLINLNIGANNKDLSCKEITKTDGVYHPVEGASTHFMGHALFSLIKPEISLLEIGCGSGARSCTAARSEGRVLATDISRMLMSVRRVMLKV